MTQYQDIKNKDVTVNQENINIKEGTLNSIKYGKYIAHSIFGTLAQTSTNYGIIFIARHQIEIIRITESHAVAGTNAGAVTLNVLKVASGVAIASGVNLIASTFDLKSTADTPIIKEGVNLTSSRILKENDRIGLVVAGTLTDLSDVCITIYYKEINQGYIR